jgi:hypothetical protein
MKSRRPEEERRKKKEETHNKQQTTNNKQQTRRHQCVNALANGERENMMENRHNDTPTSRSLTLGLHGFQQPCRGHQWGVGQILQWGRRTFFVRMS